MKLGSLAVVACLVLASSASAAAPTGAAAGGEKLNFGRFGKVAVVKPEGAPRQAVLFFSGDAGWKAGEQELAKALAANGVLVLGMDTPAYLKALGASSKCGYLAGDLESLSQYAQKKLGLPEYLHPVVVGQGAGATLAYAGLVQGPVGTFYGAVSLGFSADVRMPGTLCKGSGLVRQRTKSGKGELIQPAKAVPAPWRLLVGEKDSPFTLDKARAFTANVQGAAVQVVPAGGWKDALLQAEAEVVRLSEPPRPPTASSAPDGSALVDVSDLPLIEVPATKEGGDTLAVLLSGDGGWAGMDRDVASVLADAGIPVVGWDSLRYFWRARTPEETAKDLGRALVHYQAAWSKPRVLLVGYSRGADVLPSVAARLAPERRQSVRAVALIAPSQEAELEVHVMDLIGGGGGAPVLPEVKALNGLPVVCLYGSDEADESLCPLLSDVPGAKSVMLQGGHHFGGDYAAVGRAILEPLKEGAAP